MKKDINGEISSFLRSRKRRFSGLSVALINKVIGIKFYSKVQPSIIRLEVVFIWMFLVAWHT
jgi:hypothetical protein